MRMLRLALSRWPALALSLLAAAVATTWSGLSGATPAAASTQLLVNAGFEQGATGWNLDSPSEVVVQSNAHSGAYALRLGTAESYVDQVLSAAANQSFALSGWGKISVIGESGSIGAIFYDGAGAQLREYSLSFSRTNYGHKSVSMVAPSGTASIHVYAYKNVGSGYFFADELALSTGATSTSSPTPIAASPTSTPQPVITLQPTATPQPTVAAPPTSAPAGSVSVMDYGARGDGAGDDTAAIRTAIAHTPSGGTLYFPQPASSYVVTGSLNIPQSMTVLGSSSTVKMNSPNTNLFNVTSSNVTIQGMIMRGADQSGGIAVQIEASGILYNVNVIGNTIDNWFDGILLENVDTFKVNNNRLTNLNAYGVDTWPASHGQIDSNFVQYVSANNSDGNAYGIVLSGITPSDSITVTNNDVEDIPNWECYDTHGGSNLTFQNNYCRNAKVGFNIVWNGSNSPLNVTVDHNTVVYGGGTSWGAIVFGGSDQPGAALGTGSITNNTIVGYGSLQIYTGRATVTVSGNVVQ